MKVNDVYLLILIDSIHVQYRVFLGIQCFVESILSMSYMH
jgi:hypothetical protein